MNIEVYNKKAAACVSSLYFQRSFSVKGLKDFVGH